jgi:cellulose synthase/poly-beta-1,6-N-acetylglucosamine synthase-like glycosyltransferase
MTHAPQVAVVVPTYKRPEALGRCVRALMDQRVDWNYEVIVVNDGDPGEIPSDDLPPGVRLIDVGGNNASQARNVGARAAEAGVLVFLDDDCKPLPGFLAELVTALESADAVGARTINAAPGSPLAQASQVIEDELARRWNPDHGDARFLSGRALAFRREAFLSAPFDERFASTGGEDRALSATWRALGRRLRYEPRARVLHHGPRSLKEFVAQHRRYGRGAWALRRNGDLRGDFTGPSVRSPVFYAGLVRAALASPQRPRSVAALVLLTQVVMVVSYLATALEEGLKRRLT